MLARRAAISLVLGMTWRRDARPAYAAKDCYLDCITNCNRVAPGSGEYCKSSCNSYCLQDDRRDGLSGSVSSEGSELGWASAYDLSSRVTGQQRAVPYGEDRPPSLLPSAVSDAVNEALRGAVRGDSRR
jgi:hypothetical protein